MKPLTVQDIAKTYVQQVNPDGLVPFPFQKLLQLHPEVQVLLLAFPEHVQGTLEVETQNTYKLYLNSSLSKQRQDVALAILLAHRILHLDQLQQEKRMVLTSQAVDGSTQLVCPSGVYPDGEQEAYAFAFELMMPESLAKKAWATFAQIEEVAKLFQLPIPFVSRRLAALGCVS